MKVVILAGGYGTRLSEHTSVVPKPLVEIGGRPILWHIMRLYSHHGLNEFVICCGYKGSIIKDYFLNYMAHQGDFTIDLQRNRIETHRNGSEPWKVTLVDTGEKTMTGGRLKRVRDYLGNSTFCLTYGDGVSDVNIRELINFHHQQGALATVTAVQLAGRFGAINLSSDRPRAARFREKDARDGQVINGGFFVVEPEALDLIDDDSTSWENEPLARLSEQDQLAVYRHHGYWQNMDTLRDKAVLQELWDTGKPPWCVWNNEPATPPKDTSKATATCDGRSGPHLRKHQCAFSTQAQTAISARCSGPKLLDRGHEATGIDTGLYRRGWLFDDGRTRPMVISKDVRQAIAVGTDGTGRGSSSRRAFQRSAGRERSRDHDGDQSSWVGRVCEKMQSRRRCAVCVRVVLQHLWSGRR